MSRAQPVEARDANEGGKGNRGNRGGRRTGTARLCLYWTAHGTCYRGWACAALRGDRRCAEPGRAPSVTAWPIAGRCAFAHRYRYANEHPDEHGHLNTTIYRHPHVDARAEQHPHWDVYT